MHDWNRFFYHLPRNLSNSIYRIFEPEWKPKILEWFTSKEVTPAQKEALLYALTHFEDTCGGFFQYRAYFLAAEAIAYFQQSVQADQIIRQLLLWSYTYFRQDKNDWKTYPTALTKAARRVLELTDRDRVIAQFEQLLHTTDSRLVLRVAAERLCELDPGNACGIAALDCLVQVAQTPHQILVAVKSLMKIAPDHPAIIPALLKITQISFDGKTAAEWNRFSTVFFYLRSVAIGDQEAINALLEQLRNWQEQDRWVLQILQTFETIARGSLEVIEVLQQIIHTIVSPTPLASDWENLVLQCSLDTLRVIAVECPDVVSFLSRLFYETRDPEHQHLIAATVVWLEPQNVDAIALLTRFLETELPQDGKYRVEVFRPVMRAAVALLKADPRHPLALDALFYVGKAVLPIYDPTPPRELLKLKEVDIDHQIEHEVLLRLVESAQPETPIGQVIRRFVQLSEGDERDIKALKRLAQTTRAYNLAAMLDYCHASTLHHVCIPTTVIPMLEQTILVTSEEYERETAAYCLGKLVPDHPLVGSTLMQVWKRTSSESAVWRLLQLGIAGEVTVQVLVQLLQARRPSSWLLDAMRTIGSTDFETEVVQRLKPALDVQPKRPTNIRQSFDGALQSLLVGVEENIAYTSADRADVCYQVIWNCAQSMSYRDFCKAWLSFSPAF